MAVSVLALAAICACTTAPTLRTTRLTDADFAHAIIDIRQQLVESRFLTERTPDTQHARLVIRRVENLSTDRLSEAEQWSLVARVISDTGVQELLRAKRVTVQLPPEKIALLERGGFDFPDLDPECRPTHMLSAQIFSATRAGSLAVNSTRDDIRKEYYLLSFALEDIQTREVLWQGTTEIAREAEGAIVD